MIRVSGPLWGLRELAAALRPGRGPGQLDALLRERFGAPGLACLPIGWGRAALELAFRGLKLAPGAKVVLPAMCCDTLVLPVVAHGLEPVYVDTEEGTFCMDPARLAQTLQRQRIGAVIAAHFLGQRNDMQAIGEVCRAGGVPVIDDSAYLAGHRTGQALDGAQGAFGLWSFHEKLLFGARGAVLIGPEARIAELARSLPAGQAQPALRARLGLYAKNRARRALGSRAPAALSGAFLPPKDWRARSELAMPAEAEWPASPFQCALMSAQLRGAGRIFARARRTYQRYHEALAGQTNWRLADLPHGGTFGRAVPLFWSPEAPGEMSAEQMADRSWAIRRHLYEHGVQTLGYTPPWWSPGQAGRADLPHCQDLWPRALYVPSHPLISAGDVKRICRLLDQALRASARAGQADRAKGSQDPSAIRR